MYYFFFLPLGTDVIRRHRPVLTGLLVVLNVVVYIFAHHVAAARPWLWRLALVPADPHPWSALGACFLHVNLFHLLGNMLYLVLFGAPLEDRLGRARFAAVYLLSGWTSMYLQAAAVMLWSPALAIYAVVGASGSIAGLLGAFMIRLPAARVRVASVVLMLLHGVNRADLRSVNAVAAILFWMLLQLVYGLATTGAGPGEAYWAHLGGLASGAALALLLGGARAGRADRHRTRGESYMRSGAWFAAAGEFEAAVRERPDDVEGRLLAGRALVAAGARRRALATFARALSRLATGGDAPRLAAAYQEMLRLLPGAVLPARVQMAVVRALLDEGEYAAAVAALDDLAAVEPGSSEAELARLASAELHAAMLGNRAEALRQWRAVDPRQLPARWQRHLGARLRGQRGERRRSA